MEKLLLLAKVEELLLTLEEELPPALVEELLPGAASCNGGEAASITKGGATAGIGGRAAAERFHRHQRVWNHVPGRVPNHYLREILPFNFLIHNRLCIYL